MSQSVLKKQPEDINKDKIISKSNKPNKISKLTNYNFRNDSLINFSPKEKDKPYKINYANTEGNIKNTNIHSNLKSAKLKTTNNIKKLNEIELESPVLNKLTNNMLKKNENNINKYRIISANILKNKKRSQLINTEINNKKEAQVYLNSFVDKSISKSYNKKNISSRGFMSKADAETDKIIKKKNKKHNVSYKTSNHIKNLDFNFHKNNFKFSYISTEKNQNNIKKQIYYDLLLKYKILKDNEFKKKLKNKDDKENNLINIINNITRKVQFLNSKNIIISNENTMNLLSKEEYFLYQKLKEYLKNDYTIKKFSKSIFDIKNGNKYLLPLFNDFNFSNANKEEKNKNEISKEEEDYDDFKFFKSEIKNQFDINQKKRIEFYFNNPFPRQKQDKIVNNIYFPSRIDQLNLDNQNQRVIKLNKSSDRIDNLQKFYKIFNNNKQIVALKNNNKQKLIEKQHYQEYKMKLIQENENKINNYFRESHNSTKEFSPKKPIYKNIMIKNIKPIKKFGSNKKEEVKNIVEENAFKNNKSKNDLDNNIPSKYKKIKISYSEKRQLLKNKENNKNEKINNKNIETNKVNRSNEKLITNKKQQNENTEENIQRKSKIIARLSTKNHDENSPFLKTDKISNNEDIKNLLNRENNVYSDFLRIYKNNKANYNNDAKNNENKNINNNEEKTNKKQDLQKNVKDKENISKTLEVIKNEENNLTMKLNTITISNNMILSETLKKEENKLIPILEMKREKILKILYSFLKKHLKDINGKDKIKQLLKKPEFKTNFDLLKSQMNQINKLTNDNSSHSQKTKPLTDDDIIDYLYEEFNKQKEKKVVINTPKSSYVASLHLKKRKSTKKVKIEKIEEKKEEENKINENIQKENEKLQLMANEISLTNDLKNHIRETYNKQFKARFKNILEKIESYQKLSTDDYINTFKSNYSLLKDEMNQVLQDKEREERINSFMDNLDSERSIFETKWNFCSNKISVLDSKFETSLERFKSNKNTKNKI